MREPPWRSIAWMPFWTRFQIADFRRFASAGSSAGRTGSVTSIVTCACSAVSARSESVCRDDGGEVGRREGEVEGPAVGEEVVDEGREAVDLLAERLDARAVVAAAESVVGRAVAAPEDVEARARAR